MEGPGEELNFEQKLMVFCSKSRCPYLRVIFGLPIPYLDNSDLIFWCIWRKNSETLFHDTLGCESLQEICSLQNFRDEYQIWDVCSSKWYYMYLGYASHPKVGLVRWFPLTPQKSRGFSEFETEKKTSPRLDGNLRRFTYLKGESSLYLHPLSLLMFQRKKGKKETKSSKGNRPRILEDIWWEKNTKNHVIHWSPLSTLKVWCFVLVSSLEGIRYSCKKTPRMNPVFLWWMMRAVSSHHVGNIHKIRVCDSPVTFTRHQNWKHRHEKSSCQTAEAERVESSDRLKFLFTSFFFGKNMTTLSHVYEKYWRVTCFYSVNPLWFARNPGVLSDQEILNCLWKEQI